MIFAALGLALAPAAALPAAAQSPFGAAIETSLAACDAWVMRSETWSDSVAGFPQKAGLAGQIVRVDSVPDFALPPEELRIGRKYWRVPVKGAATEMFVTTSDQLTFCHVAARGAADLASDVAALLASPDFAAKWAVQSHSEETGLASVNFVSKGDDRLSMIVSRPEKPGVAGDHVQLLITTQYDYEN